MMNKAIIPAQFLLSLTGASLLHAQVNDMATVFPIREQLDIRDEEALTYIFSSKAGREYLLCEAAVNGSF